MIRGLSCFVTAVCAAAVAVGPALAAAPLEWTKPKRLSVTSARSRTALNFAHGVAVDGAGGVHAIWYERPGGADAVATVHYRRAGEGGSWEESRILSGPEGGEYPSILATDAALMVVWHSTGEAGRVWMRDSTDGGDTWSVPFSPTDSTSVVHASIAADGPALHLVWVDSRSGEAEIYYRPSPDHGATWAPEMRISAAEHDSWTPSLAAGDGLVVVAWVDTRDGNEEEYVRVSRDAGESWGEEMRLTVDEMNSWAPSVAVAGGVIHLTWFDQRDNEFHLRDSEAMLDQAMQLLGLETESPPEGILVPDPSRPGRMTFYSKAFQHRVQEKSAAIGNAVHPWVEAGGDPRRVARLMGEFNRRMWIASREWELYYAHSEDRGASFGELRRLTEAEGSSSRPNLAAVGSRLHLVWFDDRYGESEIFYKTSEDRGASWSDDLRMTDAQGASEQPMVAAGVDGRVHVVWFDERAGQSDIYYQRGDPR